jgi:hypothetical protein
LKEIASECERQGVITDLIIILKVEIRQYFINAAESRLQMDFLDARTIWLRTLTEASIRNLSQESGSSADFEHGLNTTTSSGMKYKVEWM